MNGGGGAFELRHWRPHPRPKSLLIPDSPNLDPLKSPPPNGGYTSLCELISGASPTAASASAVNSPSAAATVEIRIRNRLVKQAAYAYLQPTPSTVESSRRRRRCFSPLRRALASCFGFLGHLVQSICIRKRS